MRDEAAFREGYLAGYVQGGDDQSKYEWGGGLTHRNVRKRDETQAWNDSEAKRRIDEAPEYQI